MNTLKNDPDLPFLGMAWSHSGMMEFFRRHVLPVCRPGQDVVNIAIQDMTYFAGRKCDILYSIQLGDAPEGKPVWVVATFTKDGRAERIFARHYTGDEGSPEKSRSGSAVSLSEYRCLVEWFPSDWGLPSLSLVMDAGYMASLLRQLGLHFEDPVNLEVTVLRYRPRLRCVIRYEAASPGADGPKSVIGKIYPPGPKAMQAWRALNVLYDQATVNVTIPQPLGLVPEKNLVLMECVPGTSVKQELKEATRRRQAEEIIQSVVTTLTWLHSLTFESPEVWSLQMELDHLRAVNARVRLVAPELAQQVSALLDHIEPHASQSRLETMSCIHGDCKPSQFIVGESKLAVVDFDGTCAGDAAVDVGNFMAALHEEAVRGLEYRRELAAYFLAEYERRSGQKALVNRARVFQAASLLRMALRSFKRSPNSYGSHGVDSLPVRLLREAARCLAGL